MSQKKFFSHDVLIIGMVCVIKSIVFATNCGIGREGMRFYKRLSEMIQDKMMFY